MPAVAGRGRARRTKNEINMVPFIDVMLVLLIIFMVTAPLIVPSQIELPSVGQASRQPDRFVQIVIEADGQMKVKDGTSNQNAETTTLPQLVATVSRMQGPLKQGDAPVPVVISADKTVKYEAVVKAMDTLQRAGIQRVGLSVTTAN